jgi:hypothetical protein
MKKDVIIYSAILVLLLIGCKDHSDNPVISKPVEYDTLVPLNIGNYWLYQGYYLNDDGSVNFPQSAKFGFIIDDTISQTISGERTVCYKLFNCGEELTPYYDKPGSFEGSKLIYHNKNGLFYSGIEKYDTLKIAFNDLIFPYPTKTGNSVSAHVFYYSTLGNYSNIQDDIITDYICISTDSLFTTPIGDFRCIVYKMTYSDLEPLYRAEVYYFIKPGVGIVGMVQMAYHYSSNKYTYLTKHVLMDYKNE